VNRTRLAVRVSGLLLALALGTGLVLWLIPSSEYILLPDRARPVEPLVTVPHEAIADTTGGIYYVDVVIRRATILEHLFPSLREGATILPAEAINTPGVSDKQRQAADLREMSRSQSVAAAVALRALGKKVVARPTGVLVSAIDPSAPAAGKLQPTDLITAVDGNAVRTLQQLRSAMAAKHPGDTVRYALRRGNVAVNVALRTVPAPDDPKRAIVGFAPEQGTEVTLPIHVTINAGEVGGPSAGLAFALDIVEELGSDVDRGHRVAATGELFLDGGVGPVGGIQQKTIGARRAGAEVFIVPAGDNAAEARRFAGGMRVIAVDSFRQALAALATLSPKR
jgi:PDZ domain-containing protein